MSVLASLSARQMYHRSTREPVNGPAVVRFLLHRPRVPPLASPRAWLGWPPGSAALPRGEEVLPAVRAAEVGAQPGRSAPRRTARRSTTRWTACSCRSPRCTASCAVDLPPGRGTATDLAVSADGSAAGLAPCPATPTSAVPLRRGGRRGRRGAPGLAQPRRHAGPPGWRGGRAAAPTGRPPDRGAGRQLPVPRRRRRQPAVAARSGAARPHRRGMGAAGRGDRAAGPACSTPSSPTSTAMRRLLRGGVVPPEAVLGSSRVPVAGPDQPAAAAAAPGRLRRRPRAHQRRRVAGAARPDRRPVGRGLRPPQPHRALARLFPDEHRDLGVLRPRRRSSRRCAPALAALAPEDRPEQPHGRAHVRARPPELLRALVPGRAARLQPGRGRRPDGAPRSGLAALARRAGAGRRAAPPDRRRRRRPPGARRRQRQGGARAAPRLPPRHHRAGQRAGLGRGRASWRCNRSSAAACQAPARPAAPPAVAGDAVVRRPRRSGPRWSTASTRWSCTSPGRTATPARSSSTTWARPSGPRCSPASGPTPSRFVAQEKVDFATTPMLRDGAVVPGTIVLRVHAVVEAPWWRSCPAASGGCSTRPSRSSRRAAGWPRTCGSSTAAARGRPTGRRHLRAGPPCPRSTCGRRCRRGRPRRSSGSAATPSGPRRVARLARAVLARSQQDPGLLDAAPVGGVGDRWAAVGAGCPAMAWRRRRRPTSRRCRRSLPDRLAEVRRRVGPGGLAEQLRAAAARGQRGPRVPLVDHVAGARGAAASTPARRPTRWTGSSSA